MSTGELHVYRRRVDLGAGDSIARVAGRIREGAAVLDVGTGTGALGEFLTPRGCVVDGANYNEEELELARPHYRRLCALDLERALLSEAFVDARYDFIVFADVLEHLRDPARVLADARALLAPEGRVLISLPNIGYAGVVANLLAGEFRYTEEGILDDTHVRFFTRASLSALLARCGFQPTAWDAVTKPLSETEFRDRYPDALAPALARALTAHADSLVYQFVVEAADARAGASPAALPSEPPPELAFVVQVFWARPGDEFGEDRSSRALARIGRLRQRVSLPIGLEGAVRLRFDPADRPGTMRLASLRVVDDAGAPVWAWSGRADDFEGQAGVVVAPSGFARPGVTLGLLVEDPALVLALGDAQLPAGARLECEIDWPMSSDTLALAQVARAQLAPLAPGDAPACPTDPDAGLCRFHEVLEASRRREVALEGRVRELEDALSRAVAAAEDAARAHERDRERDPFYARLFRKPRP